MRRLKDISLHCHMIWIEIVFIGHREIQREGDEGNVLSKLLLVTAAFLRLCCNWCMGLVLLAFCDLRVAVHPNELHHFINE